MNIWSVRSMNLKTAVAGLKMACLPGSYTAEKFHSKV